MTVNARFPAQSAVVRNAKPMRFVADALNQVQLRRVVVKANRVFAVGKENLLLLLRQPEHRDVRAHVQQRLPRETQLLQMAKAQGAAAIGGMAMLVWQAADAQTIWFGREFDPQAVAGVVEEALAEMERVFHG